MATFDVPIRPPHWSKPLLKDQAALPDDSPRLERVQRSLARAGYGSRRATEELIRAGRVRINGRLAVLGDRVDPHRDAVTLDGVPVVSDPERRYYVLNKPVGVTTTLKDPHASKPLLDLLPSGPRVFPVGRLDRDSEGLLLLTNDGDLAFRLQHPRYGVEKEYLVEVQGAVGSPAVKRLMTGVELADGPARAVSASVVDVATDRSSVRVVMVQGRKREVRRMLEAIGHPVRRLVRTRIGPMRLGRMTPGSIRKLSPAEVADLYATAYRR